MSFIKMFFSVYLGIVFDFFLALIYDIFMFAVFRLKNLIRSTVEIGRELKTTKYI